MPALVDPSSAPCGVPLSPVQKQISPAQMAGPPAAAIWEVKNQKITPTDDDGTIGHSKGPLTKALDPPRPRRDSVMALQQRFEEIQKMKSRVLDPASRFMRNWDSIIACCLVFTAVVTPFEIAFFELVVGDFLFVVNRLVDLGFFFDIFVNFSLAYFDPRKGMMIVDPGRIRGKYLKGWFTIDVLSLVPWDLLNVGADDGAGGQRRLAAEGAGGQMKLLRLLKILKLTKLLRLVKSARIFKRVATHLGLTFGIQLLIKYFVIMVCATHWVACGWGMVPTFMDVQRPVEEVVLDDGLSRMLKGGGGAPASVGETSPGLDWIMRVEDQLEIPPGGMTVAHKYAYCLEYALGIMCMGYASVTQENLTELWYSVMCLVVAGSLYAYMIGGICSALALEDPAETQYKENMDLLMKFMDDMNIPNDLRVKSYEYMEYCKQLMQHRFHVQVLELMPSSLRGDICIAINGEWLNKMKFFNPKNPRENREFTMAISVQLEPMAYPPAENIYVVGDRSTYLYIVTRGLIKHMLNFNFGVLIPGAFFGEDFLVEDYFRHATTRTLSYAECSLLHRDSLYEILDDRPALFKETARLIRREAVRIQLYDRIVAIGHQVILLKMKEGMKRVTPQDIVSYKARVVANREEKLKAHKKAGRPTEREPEVEKSEKDIILEKLAKLTAKDQQAVMDSIINSHKKDS